MKKFFKPFFIGAFLIFNSASAWADYGMFMVVKGDVKVQKSDHQMSAAKVGQKVAVGDTIISAIDSRAKIVMSDRNVISISPSTQLKIEKYQSGENKNVELSLSEGKVRNNVEQEYDGEKTKFIIKTPTAVAGVRGTQFVTSYDPKTSVTNVVTLRGQVALGNLTGANSVLVGKGQESTVGNNGAPAVPKPASMTTMKSLETDFSDSKDKSNEGKDKKESKGAAKDKPKISGVDSKDKQASGLENEPGTLTNAPRPLPPITVPPVPPTPKTPPVGKTQVIVVPTKGN